VVIALTDGSLQCGTASGLLSAANRQATVSAPVHQDIAFRVQSVSDLLHSDWVTTGYVATPAVPGERPTAPAAPVARIEADGPLQVRATAAVLDNGGAVVTAVHLRTIPDGIDQTSDPRRCDPMPWQEATPEPISSYVFALSAVTAAGEGPPSFVTAAAVPGAPDPPEHLTVTLSGTDATLQWDPPAADHGPLLSYQVGASGPDADHPPPVRDVAATDTTVTLHDLIPGIAYSFGVSARNLNGSSLPAVAGPGARPAPALPSVTAGPLVATRAATRLTSG
jgi:Fibronectin type III domain